MEFQDFKNDSSSNYNKLWKLGSNPFIVLGEAFFTGRDIALTIFGDLPPEPRLGLADGSFPKSIEAALEMIHPKDKRSFQRAIKHSMAIDDPFVMNYRLSDGKGGWRWIEGLAVSVEVRDTKPIRWIFSTRDFTAQREMENALRLSRQNLEASRSEVRSEQDKMWKLAANAFSVLGQARITECGIEQELFGDGFEAKVGLVPGTVRVEEHRDIVGQGPALTRVLEQVELVSCTPSTILISGETGTGKELIARAIHRRSDRRNRSFVAVNCAALPQTLVESELFGHEKGAFTGATARRAGRFEQADGGTLLLDEVGEMPIETQAKMLRVLQSGEFERVGGERTLKVNVRVIAASNRDLEQAVRDGRFRSDLYHRLAIFPIHIPPLRERLEDIPLIVAYLVNRKASHLGRAIERIPNSVLDLLTAYDWPGNVRELENVLERAIILSPGNSLRLEAIQLGRTGQLHSNGRNIKVIVHNDLNTSDSLQSRERAHILHICQTTNWKIKGTNGAAKRLGLNPATLYFRMKKLGVKRPEPEPR